MSRIGEYFDTSVSLIYGHFNDYRFGGFYRSNSPNSVIKRPYRVLCAIERAAWLHYNELDRIH